MIGAALISAITLMGLYIVLDMPLIFNETHLKLLTAFGFRVNLFLNCVNAIVYYMDRLKKTQVEAEKLKKISIEAQFEALRNQINPHFLFNCFNVLSSLVYKDADTSAKFIAQLSNVYRYLLFNQDKKVILLKEELSFMDSYLYLLKIRFGENVIVDRRINVNVDKFYIAPATLQMLIENAIKHNVASKKNPLCISIITENEYITVINNLFEKEDKEQSTHIGLNNIQSRYNFLSDKNIIIDKNDFEFKVSIPLLEVE
jgi:two-component system, LytTR family, sensor kinase